jgi:hypothetical protein
MGLMGFMGLMGMEREHPPLGQRRLPGKQPPGKRR